MVQAAAGGVGTAVVQLAKLKGCEVFGTAGSDEKMEYMQNNGVDHPINYRKKDFYEEIKNILGIERLDVAFDSVGGKTYSKSKKLLGAGGRIVNYGAAVRTGQSGGIFANIRLAWNMGLMHPLGFIMKSQSAIGVNMLRLGDYKPERMQRCMQNVILLAEEGKLKPHVGASYKANEINDAHKLLEGRKSVGKIVVEW